MGCGNACLAAFTHAPTRLIRLAPGDVGLARIGHLGAFKPGESQGLWMRLAEAVDAHRRWR